jgi:hypothetical protein
MTIKQRLVDALLDEELGEYVRKARAAGESWQRISMALSQKTGLYVTYESLRSWYPEHAKAASGGAA